MIFFLSLSLQVLLNDILRVAEDQLDLEEDEEGGVAKKSKLSTLTHDHLRVLELFRRIAREWSEEGAAERKQSFGLLGRKKCNELFRHCNLES